MSDERYVDTYRARTKRPTKKHKHNLRYWYQCACGLWWGRNKAYMCTCGRLPPGNPKGLTKWERRARWFR